MQDASHLQYTRGLTAVSDESAGLFDESYGEYTQVLRVMTTHSSSSSSSSKQKRPSEAVTGNFKPKKNKRRGKQKQKQKGSKGLSQMTTPLPFFKMVQNLDLRCVLISDPSTLGAGAKTRLMNNHITVGS